MPLPGTPSPFRLSRRQPSTRRSGPQFANSPRFLLSQSTPQKGKNDLEIVDDDNPPSTAPVASTPASQRNAIPPRWKRDVIEDYDEDELPRSTGTQRRGTELVDDVIDSSPPKPPATPGPLDPEYEALFATVEDSHKRRRVSEQPSLAQKLHGGIDQTSSSPEGPGQFAAPETPASHIRPRAATQNPNPEVTPRMPPRPIRWTPGPTSTPFRSKPRFVLSAKKPPSSQPVLGTQTPAQSQPTSTPLEKRKPTFVLPRSPSPNSKTEDIPAPFSPSSRTLRRRGKARAGATSYVPGGMAADVRSWILETGSKREQALHSRLLNTDSEAGSSGALSRYLVAVRVVSVSHAMLSSSGPLAFITAETVNVSREKEEDSNVLNILALGPPKSKPRSSSRSIPVQIQQGDLLGFHRGLAWDIDLHDPQISTTAAELETAYSQVDVPGSGRKRWLVAMEWDLVEEAT
ncbi:hypothetical protein N7494_007818 [Penicillium frequentans]|uniref:Uncharacterized protein n=1 Tax=Penicillium frequentans TaxID=3151616 RepID=A0AAD6CT80_9EURO|nr:hypothetical protein N7494_007818 [Penicillium glabrum]